METLLVHKLDEGRQPRLSTIKMIEEAVKENSGVYSKTQLWKHLNKKMMYPTYCTIIDYLEESRKITFNNKKIIWIFDPEAVSQLNRISVQI